MYLYIYIEYLDDSYYTVISNNFIKLSTVNFLVRNLNANSYAKSS